MRSSVSAPICIEPFVAHQLPAALARTVNPDNAVTERRRTGTAPGLSASAPSRRHLSRSPLRYRKKSMLPILAVAILATFQIGITYWLWRNQIYTRSEKIAQTKLIWLLPCLGAVFVAIMLFEDTWQQG